MEPLSPTLSPLVPRGARVKNLCGLSHTEDSRLFPGTTSSKRRIVAHGVCDR